MACANLEHAANLMNSSQTLLTYQALLDNSPTSKTLTSKDLWNGTDYTENWMYSLPVAPYGFGAAIITGPDGGVTTQQMVRGLTYKTSFPDYLTTVAQVWQENPSNAAPPGVVIPSSFYPGPNDYVIPAINPFVGAEYSHLNK